MCLPISGTTSSGLHLLTMNTREVACGAMPRRKGGSWECIRIMTKFSVVVAVVWVTMFIEVEFIASQWRINFNQKKKDKYNVLSPFFGNLFFFYGNLLSPFNTKRLIAIFSVGDILREIYSLKRTCGCKRLINLLIDQSPLMVKNDKQRTFTIVQWAGNMRGWHALLLKSDKTVIS